MRRDLRFCHCPLRSKFQAQLGDRRVLLVAVEHWDRTTGFRFNYIALLLEAQGRRIEVINETETDTEDELVDNFVALITSIAARIHGYRVSKRWAEQMCQGVEDAYS